MNAIEIEAAISTLAAQPFDRTEFAYDFLRAFGNKETTIKRLKSGTTNKSDVGGVLQTNNIHIAVAEASTVTQTLTVLRNSPATAKGKVDFILATDGVDLEAENLSSAGQGETLACALADLPEHFGFFFSLAGISTIKALRESTFDIRATARLNKLYLELLKDNPEWATDAMRPALNHFLARLIFCFFAEDTDIFRGNRLFTDTVEQMSAKDGSNTHEVIGEIFKAMNTPTQHGNVPDDRYRKAAGLRPWADAFPYVNGGLFSGDFAVPRFSKIARTYLTHIGSLDWTKINPDIFGSMIQAVADEAERGALGMHYTSVPNILKVLNPLFLDELRAKLDDAGDNKIKLLNLRKRIARIRVFDPACGSGNFLVIAYKQLRELENTINERRGEKGLASAISLKNFRGIELRSFSVEIARLALVIAEYQCDVVYRGQKEALAVFLPLSSENWITSGNALQMDWEQACPAEGKTVKLHSDDLFQTPLDQSEIAFDNEGGEVYICGNPPYLGSTWQDAAQKADLQAIFAQRTKSWKSLDYVAGWFMKAADYCAHNPASAAFVSTNSICQGQQVPILWPLVFATGNQIHFAHTSFKWTNLASHNAGVTVAIVGITAQPPALRKLYAEVVASGTNGVDVKEVANINPYLVPGENIVIEKKASPYDERSRMDAGGKPVDGGNLLLSTTESLSLHQDKNASSFLKRVYGASEYIRGDVRFCLWITDADVSKARASKKVEQRLAAVASFRSRSPKLSTQKGSVSPHKFEEVKQSGREIVTIVPKVSSESRSYLPVGLLPQGSIVTDLAFALYDAPLWNLSLIASRLHLVWIGTVCGKLKTDFRYSNTLGWNTFPIPKLTEKNKADLTRCAEDILLAREVHFPATIADLYEPGKMPENLRHAHERNDEVLERIYIGRRFKNDTERLEKLFTLYNEMTQGKGSSAPKGKKNAIAAEDEPEKHA